MKQLLPNWLYDLLKYLCIIGLPALEKFVPSFFPRWGIPYAEQIAGSLNDFEVLLGALICVSVIQYNTAKKEEEKVVDYNEEGQG